MADKIYLVYHYWNVLPWAVFIVEHEAIAWCEKHEEAQFLFIMSGPIGSSFISKVIWPESAAKEYA